ncbi:MAG: VWA domain-containing protein [Rhizobacter sp.]
MVTLRYAQTLRFEQRSLRLMVPTVIAPRYGDAVVQGGLQPHQVPGNSLLIDDYPFDLELRIGDAMNCGRVASPSHPIRVAHVAGQGEDHLIVSLARQGSLDRDFVLVIDQLTDTTATALGPDAAVPGRVVALASFCPSVPNPKPVPVCAKILVDCSGSMLGDSISAAKHALKEIVTGLKEGDRFSLSKFGSEVEHLGRGMWLTTDITRTSALEWVAALNAHMGGTEMVFALSSTYALPSTQASDVLLITDGEISQIDAAIESAQRSGHRLFIVGIGSSPAESHLRRLAEATHGVCEFVAPGEAVQPAVLRMFARLRAQPSLHEAEIRWPKGSQPLWVSALPESIFDGDTVNVFAVFDQAPSGEVQLMARNADGSSFEMGRHRINASIQASDTLSRMAAADRIHSVQTSPNAEASEEVLRLALDYQLITDRTNFLLVHERADADRANSMPKLHKVVQMMPAGWAGAGTRTLSEHSAGVDHLSHPEVFQAPSPVMMCQHPSPEDRERWRLEGLEQLAAWRRGLSPLEFSCWLQNNPSAKWPITLGALTELGVPKIVQMWLSGACPLSGKAAPSRLEAVVLRAFLHVMSHQETRDALTHSVDFQLTFRRHLESIKAPVAPGADVTWIDEIDWIERVMNSLADMTSDAWPDNLIWPTAAASMEMLQRDEVVRRYVDGSRGLTPIGISKWLRLTDPALWPDSYAKLEQIGLLPAVVNRLADAVERRYGTAGSTERSVVQAFVFVMAQTETHDALKRSEHVFKAIAERLMAIEQQGRSVTPTSTSVDHIWLERMTIAYALRDMVWDAWPDGASMAAQPSWRSKAREALAERFKGLAGIAE